MRSSPSFCWSCFSFFCFFLGEKTIDYLERSSNNQLPKRGKKLLFCSPAARNDHRSRHLERLSWKEKTNDRAAPTKNENQPKTQPHTKQPKAKWTVRVTNGRNLTSGVQANLSVMRFKVSNQPRGAEERSAKKKSTWARGSACLNGSFGSGLSKFSPRLREEWKRKIVKIGCTKRHHETPVGWKVRPWTNQSRGQTSNDTPNEKAEIKSQLPSFFWSKAARTSTVPAERATEKKATNSVQMQKLYKLLTKVCSLCTSP